MELVTVPHLKIHNDLDDSIDSSTMLGNPEDMPQIGYIESIITEHIGGLLQATA